MTKGNESQVEDFAFVENADPADLSIFSIYFLTSQGLLYTVGPFFFSNTLYEVETVEILKSIYRRLKPLEDKSKSISAFVNNYFGLFLPALTMVGLEGSQSYIMTEENYSILRRNVSPPSVSR